METLLNVLRPVLSYVSDEALEDAMRLASQAKAGRAANVKAVLAPESAPEAPQGSLL